jgi:hypothetical protein
LNLRGANSLEKLAALLVHDDFERRKKSEKKELEREDNERRQREKDAEDERLRELAKKTESQSRKKRNKKRGDKKVDSSDSKEHQSMATPHHASEEVAKCEADAQKAEAEAKAQRALERSERQGMAAAEVSARPAVRHHTSHPSLCQDESRAAERAMRRAAKKAARAAAKAREDALAAKVAAEDAASEEQRRRFLEERGERLKTRAPPFAGQSPFQSDDASFAGSWFQSGLPPQTDTPGSPLWNSVGSDSSFSPLSPLPPLPRALLEEQLGPAAPPGFERDQMDEFPRPAASLLGLIDFDFIND